MDAEIKPALGIDPMMGLHSIVNAAEPVLNGGGRT